MPTYYKRDATGTANWNLATSWSTVSSTSSTNTGTFPSSATLDPVIFDANSSACTVNVTATCTSLNFTGYTNTITMTNGITVSGNVTLEASMGISGAGNLTINATSTYTANGRTWPNTLILSGTITVTLAANATVGGLTIQTNTVTINTNTLSVTGNFARTSVCQGTTVIRLTGTGTISGNNQLANDLTIDTTGTITMSGNVVITGSTRTMTLTYVQGTLVTTGAKWIFWYNLNITSNGTGINWGVLESFQFINLTLTFTDNCVVNDFTCVSGAFIVVNSNICDVRQNLTVTGPITGNTTFRFNGTGNQTWSGGNTLAPSVNINKTSGTLTISGTVTLNGGNLTYVQGTLAASGTIRFFGNGTTVTSNGVSWNAWEFNPNSQTVTLADTANVASFTVLTGGGTVTMNGSNLDIRGNLTTTAGSYIFTGTTNFRFIGTGNQTWSGTGRFRNPIVINKPSGTLTFSGTLNYGFGTTAGSTITYTAGTVDLTTNTFSVGGYCTFNTPSLVWRDIIIDAANQGYTSVPFVPLIVTLNAPLTSSNNLNVAGTTTFTGSSGWVCTNLLSSVANSIITLQNNVTYRTTTSTSLQGTAAAPILMTSDNATTRSIWTLDNGANQSIVYVNGTRIDSSGGQTIYTFQGTRTDTINWNPLVPPSTVAYTFVN